MERFTQYLTEIENVQKVKKENYGQELIVDIHDVPSRFFTDKNIRGFAEQMCDEIKMTRGPFHLWGKDKDEGTAKREVGDIKADGISCVQFLYKSSITIHALDEIYKVFVNIFSCDEFDEIKAKKFIEKKIGGNIVSLRNIVRK